MTEQLKTIPLPTRNALYAVNLLPGRRHDGHRARLDDQRPARADDQHHARRREREQQPGQGRRRVLRDGAPAARRDRAGHADDGGAGRRERGPGRGADSLRHALGHEPVLAARVYDYFRHPGAQHELLDQREERPRQEPHHPAPGRRERRRADSDSEDRTTDAARRSSSSTTRSSTSRPKRRGTRTLLNPDAQSGVFTLQRDVAAARRSRVRSICSSSRRGNGQTAIVRPDDAGAPRGDSRAAQARRATSARSRARRNTQHVHLPEPGQGRGAPADDARRLQSDADAIG